MYILQLWLSGKCLAMLSSDMRFVTCTWHVIVFILHPAVYKTVFFSGGNTGRFNWKQSMLHCFCYKFDKAPLMFPHVHCLHKLQKDCLKTSCNFCNQKLTPSDRIKLRVLIPHLAWENSQHFAATPPVSPWYDIWGTSAEICTDDVSLRGSG